MLNVFGELRAKDDCILPLAGRKVCGPLSSKRLLAGSAVNQSHPSRGDADYRQRLPFTSWWTARAAGLKPWQFAVLHDFCAAARRATLCETQRARRCAINPLSSDFHDFSRFIASPPLRNEASGRDRPADFRQRGLFLRQPDAPRLTASPQDSTLPPPRDVSMLSAGGRPRPLFSLNI